MLELRKAYDFLYKNNFKHALLSLKEEVKDARTAFILDSDDEDVILFNELLDKHEETISLLSDISDDTKAFNKMCVAHNFLCDGHAALLNLEWESMSKFSSGESCLYETFKDLERAARYLNRNVGALMELWVCINLCPREKPPKK